MEWNEVGTRGYKTGVSHGVLYPHTGPGVVWNGLVAVNETTEDFGLVENYIDGRKYNTTTMGEGFTLSVDAFTYPSELDQYVDLNGNYLNNDRNNRFGMTYRTFDMTDTLEFYELHLVYNCTARTTNRIQATESSQINVEPFRWEITTKPVVVPDNRPTAHLVIKVKNAYDSSVLAIENVLYGSDLLDARLPTISEVFSLFESTAILKITDNGDGTWTADGPDDVVYMTGPTSFEIDWSSVLYLDSNTYRVRSW